MHNNIAYRIDGGGAGGTGHGTPWSTETRPCGRRWPAGQRALPTFVQEVLDRKN